MTLDGWSRLAGVVLILCVGAGRGVAAPKWDPRDKPSPAAPSPANSPGQHAGQNAGQGVGQRAGQPAASAKNAAPTGPKLEWTESYVQATRVARQSDKVIMAYFAGSDWCEWCKKLDREVLQTPAFVEWAKTNTVPLMVDYPSPDKKHSRAVGKQNEILAATYNIAKLPTLLFLDTDGEVIDRVGYDGASLRDTESKGAPVQALARLDAILKSRPTGQQVKEYTFLEATELTEKTGQPVLLLVTKPDSKLGVETRDRLLKSGKLGKFINANMAFVNLTWPAAADVSPQAQWFRTFADGYKVGPAPLQLLVLTYGGRKLQHRILSVDQIDGLVNQLAQQLPKFDYTGSWLTDYRKAQSISAQSQRDMLLSFTSFDSSEWCQKLDAEVYQQEAFKDYAKTNLVLVRVDFPTKVEQSASLKTQNQSLAEGFNIRGYPTMVLVNAKGQKIGTAKYMPGGPDAFIKELDDLRRRDFDRRTLTSEQAEVKKPAPAK